MNITQTFYDNLAPQYDKLFQDWSAAVAEQAEILERIVARAGFDRSASVLDCACGIGTQAIGLALRGYRVTASDLSDGALAQARTRAAEKGAELTLAKADFCVLEETFAETFDIVICMDNALPHLLTAEKLARAAGSIARRVAPGGAFVASIRDYDALLADKPPYSPPYIHETADGRRVSFQTWAWEGERYRLTQYIIEDGAQLQVSKFECEYRATRRAELTEALLAGGFREVAWQFPEESGFYQPVLIAKK